MSEITAPTITIIPSKDERPAARLEVLQNRLAAVKGQLLSEREGRRKKIKLRRLQKRYIWEDGLAIHIFDIEDQPVKVAVPCRMPRRSVTVRGVTQWERCDLYKAHHKTNTGCKLDFNYTLAKDGKVLPAVRIQPCIFHQHTRGLDKAVSVPKADPKITGQYKTLTKEIAVIRTKLNDGFNRDITKITPEDALLGLQLLLTTGDASIINDDNFEVFPQSTNVRFYVKLALLMSRAYHPQKFYVHPADLHPLADLIVGSETLTTLAAILDGHIPDSNIHNTYTLPGSIEQFYDDPTYSVMTKFLLSTPKAINRYFERRGRKDPHGLPCISQFIPAVVEPVHKEYFISKLSSYMVDIGLRPKIRMTDSGWNGVNFPSYVPITAKRDTVWYEYCMEYLNNMMIGLHKHRFSEFILTKFNPKSLTFRKPSQPVDDFHMHGDEFIMPLSNSLDPFLTPVGALPIKEFVADKLPLTPIAVAELKRQLGNGPYRVVQHPKGPCTMPGPFGEILCALPGTTKLKDKGGKEKVVQKTYKPHLSQGDNGWCGYTPIAQYLEANLNNFTPDLQEGMSIITEEQSYTEVLKACYLLGFNAPSFQSFEIAHIKKSLPVEQWLNPAQITAICDLFGIPVEIMVPTLSIKDDNTYEPALKVTSRNFKTKNDRDPFKFNFQNTYNKDKPHMILCLVHSNNHMYSFIGHHKATFFDGCENAVTRIGKHPLTTGCVQSEQDKTAFASVALPPLNMEFGILRLLAAIYTEKEATWGIPIHVMQMYRLLSMSSVVNDKYAPLFELQSMPIEYLNHFRIQDSDVPKTEFKTLIRSGIPMIKSNIPDDYEKLLKDKHGAKVMATHNHHHNVYAVVNENLSMEIAKPSDLETPIKGYFGLWETTKTISVPNLNVISQPRVVEEDKKTVIKPPIQEEPVNVDVPTPIEQILESKTDIAEMFNALVETLSKFELAKEQRMVKVESLFKHTNDKRSQETKKLLQTIIDCQNAQQKEVEKLNNKVAEIATNVTKKPDPAPAPAAVKNEPEEGELLDSSVSVDSTVSDLLADPSKPTPIDPSEVTTLSEGVAKHNAHIANKIEQINNQPPTTAGHMAVHAIVKSENFNPSLAEPAAAKVDQMMATPAKVSWVAVFYGMIKSFLRKLILGPEVGKIPGRNAIIEFIFKKIGGMRGLIKTLSGRVLSILFNFKDKLMTTNLQNIYDVTKLLCIKIVAPLLTKLTQFMSLFKTAVYNKHTIALLAFLARPGIALFTPIANYIKHIWTLFSTFTAARLHMVLNIFTASTPPSISVGSVQQAFSIVGIAEMIAAFITTPSVVSSPVADFEGLPIGREITLRSNAIKDALNSTRGFPLAVRCNDNTISSNIIYTLEPNPPAVIQFNAAANLICSSGVQPNTFTAGNPLLPSVSLVRSSELRQPKFTYKRKFISIYFRLKYALARSNIFRIAAIPALLYNKQFTMAWNAFSLIRDSQLWRNKSIAADYDLETNHFYIDQNLLAALRRPSYYDSTITLSTLSSSGNAQVQSIARGIYWNQPVQMYYDACKQNTAAQRDPLPDYQSVISNTWMVFASQCTKTMKVTKPAAARTAVASLH